MLTRRAQEILNKERRQLTDGGAAAFAFRKES